MLGATGTIGKNTLDIMAQHPDKFELLGISIHTNYAAALEIIKTFSPRYVATTDPHAARMLRAENTASDIIDGENAISELASIHCDMLVHGIVGAAGMQPLSNALKASSTVALANKEALVCAGHIMMPLLRACGGMMYPVDSEHNALFQLMEHTQRNDISRMTLTASGGPFLTRALESFGSITPQEAVAHPNWNMGAKISVDSATMANKGLELIEAHYLFGTAPEMLDAVLHPQSLVHALLSLRDGSVLAHLSTPDMRLPLAYALHGGNRPVAAAKPLDITALSNLEFHPIDAVRYPMFALARTALREGASAMTCYNAANEMAVQAFLGGRIRFTDIHHTVAETLAKQASQPLETLADVLAFDTNVRNLSTQIMSQIC